MRRLFATIICDVRLQARHGFYYATVFVLIICVVGVSRLPSLDVRWLLPPLVLGNLILNTFYYIGGLILLEKGEETLEAQAVTPLRTWEYLASKIFTLTMLGLAENLVIVMLLERLRFNALPLAASIVLTSVLYCLGGIVAVARYDSVNEYLMPSIIYSSLLLVPLLPYMIRWDDWPVYLHPLRGPLLLAEAAFQPVAWWQLIYGVIYSVFWIGVMAYFGRRRFGRFIIARAGVK
jgi:fluoroquinolone transport system permease protein